MRLGLAGIAITSVLLATGPAVSAPAVRPLRAGGYRFVGPGTAPPTQARCQAAGRRCFAPAAIRSAYDLAPLYAEGAGGAGQTIAIIDASGSSTMAHDLHVYDQAFGLQPMCGEEGVRCAPGMPGFGVLDLTGGKAGSDDDWALETSLDVEAAHTIAPMANILLVEAPVTDAEQGFPALMGAEQYVIENHLATVISQSFGTTESSLGKKEIDRLRTVYMEARAAGITVLASSGDDGAEADWPASDPLVTAVGGTNLCTDPQAAETDPRAYAAGIPSACADGEPETAWSGSGGGTSTIFPGRGIPDVASEAAPATGALVYISQSGGLDGSGWYVVGGTSLSSPQWAGIVAIAAQLHGGPLGQIDQALYALPPGDFYDVTSGSNGNAAGPGWDAVTGLGTPDAAKLVPDLAAAG